MGKDDSHFASSFFIGYSQTPQYGENMDKALSSLNIFSRKSTSAAQMVWFGYTTLTHPSIFSLPMVITTYHSGCREIFSLGIPESHLK
jgi:hypothetical protein